MQQATSVLVTTTERPAGYEVKQALGQVFGVVVRSRGIGGNILASLRSIAGGDAVVMMRFDSSEIGQTMTEVVAYGTAAIIERSWT